MCINGCKCVAEELNDLLGASSLDLRAAGGRWREHAGSDTYSQVEGIHLVLFGTEPDAVKHG